MKRIATFLMIIYLLAFFSLVEALQGRALDTYTEALGAYIDSQ